MQQRIATYQALRKSIINETVCRGLDKTAPLKDSGIEWIGEIPAHWEVKRVKDICDVNPGTNKLVQPNLDSKIEFLPMSCVDEKAGKIRKYKLEDYHHVSQGYTAFQNNDVLFAKITPCMENGNCVVVEGLTNNLERVGELYLALSANALQHDLNVSQVQPIHRR